MILNTERLFPKLLQIFNPDLVMDVGSMDATHSRRFRTVLPDARLIAFEANPNNYKAIMANPEVADARVQVEHQAVSNQNGSLTFHVEEVPEDPNAVWRKGISSLHTRLTNSKGMTEVEIPSVTLESFIGELSPDPEFVAIWMDVEGAAYEALEGLGRLAERVRLIHVEVETEAIWEGQKLKPEIVALVERMGYVVIARGENEDQHDIVLVRPDDLSSWKSEIEEACQATVREEQVSGILGLPARVARRLKRFLVG